MTEEIHVFTASRWTSGNRLFPVRIEVSPERVVRIKPRFFGSNEESIPVSRVASVNIETGLLWSDIRIDSSGGTNPILSHGHRKSDAREIRRLVENFQQKTPNVG
ncbi:MAG TPA: PH domain-containing protein [Elusimicrobiota bacterium]|nr:PH domain-containing protein [Elusimicrobiota bacterium]